MSNKTNLTEEYAVARLRGARVDVQVWDTDIVAAEEYAATLRQNQTDSSPVVVVRGWGVTTLPVPADAARRVRYYLSYSILQGDIWCHVANLECVTPDDIGRHIATHLRSFPADVTRYGVRRVVYSMNQPV